MHRHHSHNGQENSPLAVILDGEAIYSTGSPQWTSLSEVTGPLTVYDRTPRELVEERARGAELVFTNKVPLDAGILERLASAGLRYVGVLATGYNLIDLKAARKLGITVCNIPAYATASVAQGAIALLLELTNRVGHYTEQVRDGRWTQCADFTFRDFPLVELDGKTIGIVGLGHTGMATAKIAVALGMKVAVYTSKAQSELPEGYIKMELDELFAAADVVSLHCPLTAETRNMVNSRRIELMKPDAMIINTARGPLVDEAALAHALNSGRIAGAGLDVLSTEPPAADNPMLTARNCVLTPHITWASEEARQRLLTIAISNAKAFLSHTPQNVVN